ncbi:hypothetical protein LH935_27970 (plasmid) [Gordonia polyisoprenivorans]|uniref:hypothetical protein n=1 Tax=Gordonia polyisoprenivorans TaxID=84595 RepID=UPI00223457D1|nr:hypothetical protein [uncultured Gordonia sp.]UZF59379.1 hypothetical protein LH935_27970 [Gordonia polyisoprenivorans]
MGDEVPVSGGGGEQLRVDAARGDPAVAVTVADRENAPLLLVLQGLFDGALHGNASDRFRGVVDPDTSGQSLGLGSGQARPSPRGSWSARRPRLR